MQRILEPELMDEPGQARAYAAADFAAQDDRFVALLGERFGAGLRGDVVDLGCGPGNITFRFAARFPGCRVLGVDGAGSMIAVAEERVAGGEPGAARCRFRVAALPDPTLPARHFAAVLSNSLLHHLHRPAVLWETVRACGAPGCAVAVGDLRRPASPEAAVRLVETYAANDPDVLRRDFHASLHAAFDPDEVRAQLAAAGLDHFTVEPIGDRHLFVSGRL